MITKTLEVRELPIEDCWKDIARVPKNHRTDSNGKPIRRATICDVTIGDKHKLLTVAALPERRDNTTRFSNADTFWRHP